jgi:hypothetical protein
VEFSAVGDPWVKSAVNLVCKKAKLFPVKIHPSNKVTNNHLNLALLEKQKLCMPCSPPPSSLIILLIHQKSFLLQNTESMA